MLNMKRVSEHEYFNGDSEIKSKNKTKSFRKTKTIGTLATDAISNLLEFDYFCEKNSDKSSVFIIVEATTEEVGRFLKEILKNQEIKFEQTKNKFKCTNKKMLFLADIKTDYLKVKSTIKFLKLFGLSKEFFKVLRNLFEALLEKI